jgi:replicative DNA helicase
VSIDGIRRHAEQLERNGGIVGGIVIDHAGLVKSEGSSAYDKATATAIAAKQLARHLNVAVVLLVQANRIGGQGADDQPVPMESARDSGCYEENADFVLALSKLVTPTDGTQPYINARLAKNRRGPQVPTTILFDPITLRLTEAVEARLGGS